MCTRAHGHDSRKLYTYVWTRNSGMHMCTMYVRRGISVSVYGFSSARRSPKLPPSLPFPLPFIQSLSLSPLSFCRLPVDSVLWTQSGIDSWTKWGGGASPCSCFFASLFDRSFMMERIAEWIGSFWKGIGFRKRSQNGRKTGYREIARAFSSVDFINRIKGKCKSFLNFGNILLSDCEYRI